MAGDHSIDFGKKILLQDGDNIAGTSQFVEVLPFIGEFQSTATSISELNGSKGKAVACNPSSSSSSSADLSRIRLMLETEDDDMEIEVENDHDQQQQRLEFEQKLRAAINVEDHNNNDDSIGAQRSTSNEMSLIFHEWLEQNKDTFTAEDLRKIKIKKSTVESAAMRLGGGQQGMKKLLKLILQWVEIYHLRRRRRRRQAREAPANSQLPFAFGQQQLQPQPQFIAQNPTSMGPSLPVSDIHMGNISAFGDGINHPYLQSTNQEFSVLESAWQPAHVHVPPLSPSPLPRASPSSGVQPVSSVASVTREARRRRMDKYRRLSPRFRHEN